MRTRLLTFKSLLLICVLAIVGGVQAWADTYTYTAEKTDFSKGSFSFTSASVTWNGSSTYEAPTRIETDTKDTKGRGVQFGTAKNSSNNTITLSTNDINGEISSISVNTATAKGCTVSLSVSIGSATLGTKTLDKNATLYEFTPKAGSNKGKITLSWNATKGSVYIKSITIVYSSSQSSVATPTITPASQSFTEPFTATISCETSGATIYYTLDGTDPTTSATRATYTDAGVSIPAQTTTLKACAEVSGEVSNVASADYTYVVVYDNIAALKAVAKNGETYKVKLTDAIVTKVNGNNCYIQDATAGILLYKKSHGYKEGQKLNGTASVAYQVFNGQNQITSLDGDINVVDGADIPCIDVELANLLNDIDKYESMRVKVSMATVTSDFVNQKGEITVGKNTIVVFNKYKPTQFDTFRKGAYVDVIGYPCTFVQNSVSTKELNVWSGDINSDEYKDNISVSDAQYATYYGADAFFMPKGMTGSVVVKNGDGIALTETYTEGTLVPAKTALVLSATKGNYSLYLGSSDETAPVDNLLHGTTTDAMTNAGEGNYKYYKLSYDDNDANLGFYWGAENGAAFMNKAGKAYLALPVTESQSMAKGFSLSDLANGTTTSIQQASIADKASSIFDINGRRVSTLNGAAKGVYIVGGKKVMVK